MSPEISHQGLVGTRVRGSTNEVSVAALLTALGAVAAIGARRRGIAEGASRYVSSHTAPRSFAATVAPTALTRDLMPSSLKLYIAGLVA